MEFIVWRSDGFYYFLHFSFADYFIINLLKTYISLYVVILVIWNQPTFLSLIFFFFQEKLPSADIPYIEDHVIKWSNSYNCVFPHRKFSALAIDTNCRTVCVLRYLKPLEPPQLNLEEFDVTPEQCMRYLSLIPFTSYNHFYSNIWLTTDVSNQSRIEYYDLIN